MLKNEFSEPSGTEILATILKEFGTGGKDLVSHQPKFQCQDDEDESCQTVPGPQEESRDLLLIPPLWPNLRVVFRRSRDGDLLDGIVHSLKLGLTGWLVTLMDGATIPAQSIRAVGEIVNGRVIRGWMVRNHGLDGRRLQCTHLSEGNIGYLNDDGGNEDLARPPPLGPTS